MNPMNVFTRFRFLGVLALSTLLLTGCERPPPESVQHGYRGTGMLNVYNPRILAEQVPLNQPPVVMPACRTTARAPRRCSRTSRCWAT
jgi:photosynthetic reaction center cytochrome c subunit